MTNVPACSTIVFLFSILKVTGVLTSGRCTDPKMETNISCDWSKNSKLA